jgi:pyruvate ferredoxin oxidoreductase alpha subunit
MSRILALTGNEAAALAMKQINPDVVAAFPITPQTELMHQFAKYVADGEVKTELVLVESEHSAMSAVVGAASAGVRAMTATSSQGLALMWEVVFIAASLRLPVVMTLVNRALSGPINIHCDHSDAMGCRDSGWIQLFAENTQEAYDNLIQAVRIAEQKELLLPVMVNYDGFIISHTTERLEVLEDQEVQKFIGEYKPNYPLLDTAKPVTYGPLDLTDYYFEHKRQEIEALTKALKVIPEVGREFGKLSGREYGFFEKYCLDDAEIALVCLGSTAGTTKVEVDKMRAAGKKVGLLKLRVFRPFPAGEILQALKNVKVVVVLDRAVSFGAAGGPLYLEVRSALMNNPAEAPKTTNFIYGLGGRDIFPAEIEAAFNFGEQIKSGQEKNSQVGFIGVRE